MREISYKNYFWQDELVKLRAMKEEDWEDFYYNRFDTPARIKVDCLVELPPTEDEARQFVGDFKDFCYEKKRIMFSIENLKGEFVGAVNLNSIDERNGTFSIGMLIDRDHRSKGYGTAAMRIVMKYAFFERRLNKYYGGVLNGNIASATMLKKVGCIQEGVRRQMYYINGSYHDMILYGATKKEFEEANGYTI